MSESASYQNQESQSERPQSTAALLHAGRLGAVLQLIAAVILVFFAINNARARRMAEYAERLQLQRPAAAMDMAQTALQAWPTYSPALITAAELHYQNGEVDTARQMLEKAVAVANSPGMPMQLLGAVLVKDKDQKTVRDGLALFQRGLRLAPPRGEKAKYAWANFAEAAYKSGNMGLAVWAFSHAREQGFTDKSLQTLLPQAYKALNMPIAASMSTE